MSLIFKNCIIKIKKNILAGPSFPNPLNRLNEYKEKAVIKNNIIIFFSFFLLSSSLKFLKRYKKYRLGSIANGIFRNSSFKKKFT